MQVNTCGCKHKHITLGGEEESRPKRKIKKTKKLNKTQPVFGDKSRHPSLRRGGRRGAGGEVTNMTESITIPTTYTDAAFDYEKLREEGLQYVQQLAFNTWTDHNVHDPGITTLELLCYAITDISYRATQPIKDLIATENGELQKPLFTASQVLVSRPVTINDYRRILIDTFISKTANGELVKVGIKNAWLQKTTIQKFADIDAKKLVHEKSGTHKFEDVNIKGFYKVLLEFDSIATADDKKLLISMAAEKLADNRNLCENFFEPTQVPQEFFRLCAEIELQANIDPFETLAEIYFQLQQYFSPTVNFYTISQLLAQGFSPDKIFEGPLLQGGFLKEDELVSSTLRKDIRLSDVIQKIFNIAGIVNIPDILIQPSAFTTAPETKWLLPVKPGFQPVMDVITSRIVFYKNGVPFVPDKVKVKALFDKKIKDQLLQTRSLVSEELIFEKGQPIDVKIYHSIQNHFPKTYGISNWGLPPNTSNERKATTLQWQGFLWFIDELFANYTAQLNEVKNLFSSAPVSHTLHTQLSDDFINSNKLFLSKAATTTALQSLVETEDEYMNRRQMYLDHLLARFAENFSDYAYLNYMLSGTISNANVIKDKEAFLNNYPALSCPRMGAINYTFKTEVWDTNNIGGFAKRVKALLGIKNNLQHSLVKFYIKIVAEAGSFKFEFTDNITSKVLLKGSQLFTNLEDCTNELEVIEMMALDDTNYKIVVKPNTKFEIRLVDKLNALLATSIIDFNTEADAKIFIAHIKNLIMNSTEEGLFVIENNLLIPELGEDAFMKICIDNDCVDCKDHDPYSFHMSILLPAYAGRFNDINYRNYAEMVLRSETPTHVMPKVCWLNNEHMKALEDAWKDWLNVLNGNDLSNRTKKLQTLVNILQNCKTIYPKARLQDCSSLEEKKLLILNQSSLGTIKTS